MMLYNRVPSPFPGYRHWGTALTQRVRDRPLTEGWSWRWGEGFGSVRKES